MGRRAAGFVRNVVVCLEPFHLVFPQRSLCCSRCGIADKLITDHVFSIWLRASVRKASACSRAEAEQTAVGCSDFVEIGLFFKSRVPDKLIMDEKNFNDT